LPAVEAAALTNALQSLMFDPIAKESVNKSQHQAEKLCYQVPWPDSPFVLLDYPQNHYTTK